MAWSLCDNFNKAENVFASEDFSALYFQYMQDGLPALWAKFSLNPYHPYRTTVEFKSISGSKVLFCEAIAGLNEVYEQNKDKLQIAISEGQNLIVRVSDEEPLIKELCLEQFKEVGRSTAVQLSMTFLLEKIQGLIGQKEGDRNSNFDYEIKSLDELSKEELERLASAQLNRYMYIYDEVDPLNKALARKTWLRTMLSNLDFARSFAYFSDRGVNYLLTSRNPGSQLNTKYVEKVYDISGFCVNNQDFERGAKMSFAKGDFLLLLQFLRKLDAESYVNFEIDNRDSNWQVFFDELNLTSAVEGENMVCSAVDAEETNAEKNKQKKYPIILKNTYFFELLR